MLQKPNKFENEFVLKQMRYTGMVEAVRVRREGYAFRPYFSDFTYEFRGIAYKYTDEVSGIGRLGDMCVRATTTCTGSSV